MANYTVVNPSEIKDLNNTLDRADINIRKYVDNIYKILDELDFGINNFSRVKNKMKDNVEDFRGKLSVAIVEFWTFLDKYMKDYDKTQITSKTNLQKILEQLGLETVIQDKRKPNTDPVYPNSTRRRYPDDYEPIRRRYPEDNYYPSDDYRRRPTSYRTERELDFEVEKLNNKVYKINEDLAKIKKELSTNPENKAEIEKLRNQLEADKRDLTGKIDQLRNDMNQRIQTQAVVQPSYQPGIPQIQPQATTGFENYIDKLKPQVQPTVQAVKPVETKENKIADVPYKDLKIDLDPSKWDNKSTLNDVESSTKTLEALGLGALGIGALGAGGAALYAHQKNKEIEEKKKNKAERKVVDFDNKKY